MDKNRIMWEESLTSTEAQVAAFIQNGLGQRFQRLDTLLKSSELNVEVQSMNIREQVISMCSSLVDENCVWGAGEEANPGDTPAGLSNEENKKRKLEERQQARTRARKARQQLNMARIPCNVIIARIKHLTMPLIDATNNHTNMVAMALNVMLAGSGPIQIPNQDELVQMLDQGVFKGRLSTLLASLNQTRQTAENLHQELSEYHQMRAKLIAGLIETRGTFADLSFSIAELDVSIFLKIHRVLSDLRNCYHLALSIDHTLSETSEMRRMDNVGSGK